MPSACDPARSGSIPTGPLAHSGNRMYPVSRSPTSYTQAVCRREHPDRGRRPEPSRDPRPHEPALAAPGRRGRQPPAAARQCCDGCGAADERRVAGPPRLPNSLPGVHLTFVRQLPPGGDVSTRRPLLGPSVGRDSDLRRTCTRPGRILPLVDTTAPVLNTLGLPLRFDPDPILSGAVKPRPDTRTLTGHGGLQSRSRLLHLTAPGAGGNRRVTSQKQVSLWWVGTDRSVGRRPLLGRRPTNQLLRA